MSKTVKKPDLFTYLNINQYLEDFYNYRKQSDRSFSYGSWALELGFTNRSFLRQIVIGRRSLTDKTIQTLCERMNYSAPEKEYFYLLVHYSKSKSAEQRNLYGRKLLQIIKSDHPQRADVQNYLEFLSSPLLPRLQILLSFQNIDKSSETLARMLGTSLHKIESALQLLQKINLAEGQTSTEGVMHWKSLQSSFRVPDKIGDAILLDYHELSLKEAIQAKSLPPAQRRYKSLLVPLSADEFEEFLQDLQVFIQQTLKKFDVDDLRSRRLYQINFNIHSVSEEG
ncbi:TIGR02147 family protein [Bdellovibrio sp. ArHS]|uniref:TIGR02147 family protein n=1 Tax=Bdellovibrio sp. ArHS TaxID=1569284 RepID=UPI000B0594EC|nr:TIGR02147 family protein [Bdellovibrio sp. ArHS]